MFKVKRHRHFLLATAKKVRVSHPIYRYSLTLLAHIVVRRKLCKLDGTQHQLGENALGISSKRHIASATDAMLTNMGLRLSKNSMLCLPQQHSPVKFQTKTINRPAPLDQHI